METTNDGENDEFPPEKWLEAPNARLITAGVETISDMKTLRECCLRERLSEPDTDSPGAQVEG